MLYAPRLSDHIRLVTSNRTNLRYFVMLLSPIQCYLIHPTLQTQYGFLYLVLYL